MMKITSHSRGSIIPIPNSEPMAIARPNNESAKMSFQFTASRFTSRMLLRKCCDWPVGLDYVFDRRVRNQHVLRPGSVRRDLIRIESDPQTLPGDRPGLVVVRPRRCACIYHVVSQHRVAVLRLLLQVLQTIS